MIPRRIKRAAKILFAPLATPAPPDPSWESLLQRIHAAPASAAAHQGLGDYYARRSSFVRAAAEYRTALAFERTEAAAYSLAAIPIGHDGETTRCMDSPVYQRIRATALRIKDLYGDKTVRILDVGGGDGSLCLFLPNAEYVLAEPMVNGLTGDVNLPERSFDVVVLCHVLEHVPTDARDGFLSKLCLKSRGQVLITGPLASSANDGLSDKLVYEITKAPWAGEHLACVLPTMDSMKAFAQSEGFPVTITPNGNVAADFWFVFASYFASLAAERATLARITQFFNTYLAEGMINPLHPNDFIVELSVGRSGAQQTALWNGNSGVD